MSQENPNPLFAKFKQTAMGDTLGIVFKDAEPGRVAAEFTPKDFFANASGNVQGGILCSFLDNIMGQSCYTMLPDGIMVTTAEITVSFMKPVPMGPVQGEARVLQSGSRVFFAEAWVLNPEGQLAAKASSTLLVMPPR